MTDPDHDAFLHRVQALTGASRAADAERMVRAVLSVLLEELPAGERLGLLSELPRTLRALPAPGVVRTSDTLRAFYERVASREGVSLGSAVEHAQSVCRALAESLSHEARHKLVSRLPDALGTLLTLPESAPPLPVSVDERE